MDFKASLFVGKVQDSTANSATRGSSPYKPYAQSLRDPVGYVTNIHSTLHSHQPGGIPLREGGKRGMGPEGRATEQTNISGRESASENPASQTAPLYEPLPTGLIVWPNDKEGAETSSDKTNECQLHHVSPNTEATLVEIFSGPTSNTTRQMWRKGYGMPAMDCTKCPKLDNTLKTQVPKEGKNAS